MDNKNNCKHNVQLAFHKGYVVSYCTKCGKILDDNIKIKDILLPYGVEIKGEYEFGKEKDT